MMDLNRAQPDFLKPVVIKVGVFRSFGEAVEDPTANP
jgi:hypothetical protein